MAPFAIGSADAQAVKVWSKLLMMQVLYKCYYGRFASTSGNMPFQIVQDLTRGAGDQIKYDMLAQMSDFGKNKNDAIEGAESNLTYYQDDIDIEQKRIAHAWFRMSQQRTIHQLRKDSMQNIRDRWAYVIDKYVFAFLCGTAGAAGDGAALAADITDHGAQALVAPDANHKITTYSAVNFSVACINDARWKAETLAVPLRKIPIAPGLEGYVMFIHPDQAKHLQEDTDWLANVQHGDPRGMKNRLWTGAMGVYNDTLIQVSNYLPIDAANVRYAVLVGAQAATVAFGNALDTLDQQRYGKEFIFSWVERSGSNDYGNIKGVSGGAIFGVKAVIFNAERFGMIRVETDES